MLTEQKILNIIRQLSPESSKYLHDDAAIVENNLVITTDSLIENTHFKLSKYTPEEIGWKALSVNLSDIAAMGAKPKYALLSLSLPNKTSTSWITKFMTGFLSCAKKYKTNLIGGNIARSKEINATVTVLGKLTNKKVGLRKNAKAGDLVFATGTFGDSACGYLLLKKSSKFKVQGSRLIRKHKRPVPQIQLGQKIVNLASRVALMDSSDGLADALIQIAQSSKVKIIVNENKIPMGKNSTHISLYGGEDYELIGTASKSDCKKLSKVKNITIIGKVKKGKGAFLKQRNGKLAKLDMKKAYQHFT